MPARHSVGAVTLGASIFFVPWLLAQQPSGQVSGVITDPQGASIPGVAVTAANVETGTLRTVETNASGTYVLSPLLVGEYTLKAAKPGFKTVTEPGIVININSALTSNLTLQVGDVEQQVTVTGAPPIVDTENQEIGNYRFQEQLKNLPIIVREVQTLVGQTAGVPYGSTDTVGGTFQNGNRSAMQVLADGGQLNPFQTTAYPAIDGIGRRADLTMPNMDTIGEFKLVTNGGSAQYTS
ncbi:MAG: carboxypeptidase-like regulatory domain-containing protein, partial [Bryobacteraceae bacterium]